MYEIYINEELTEDIYSKLIEYALSKSDAFMLVVYRYSEDIESEYMTPSRRMFKSNELYKEMVKYYEKAKKEAYIRKDIFNENTVPFLNNLKTYLVRQRNLPTEWPGIKVGLSDGDKVDICTYKICEEVKPFLVQTGGLFNWRYPYFPDDLSFFKNGYCWFYTVAHEEYSFMYVKSEEEVKMLEKMGLNFKVSECNYDESKLFYEDYEL